MAKHFNIYSSRAAYTADTTGRYTDKPCVSLADSEVICDGVNVILDFKEANCAVGDFIVYDNEAQRLGILKADTYLASALDTTRYTLGDCVFFHSELGKALFLDKTASSNIRGAAQCEYKLSGLDMSVAGSFEFKSTGYNAPATATTVTWNAGDTYAALAAKFTSAVIGDKSYSSATAVSDGIVFMVGGTGTNAVTITNGTGGASDCTLTDCSMTCKIGDTVLDDTTTHRSFQGTVAATLFPTIASQLLPANSNTYTKTVISRPNRCGMNFTRFKSYISINGSTTFVDSTASGYVFPMTEATFNACATSSVTAEKSCYDRFGGDWNAYLDAAMIDADAVWGDVGNSYGNHGAQGDLLATIFYQSHDGTWKPCYPAAYTAHRTCPITSLGCYHLSDCAEACWYMKDTTFAKVNASLSKISGSALSNGSYCWLSQEYSGYYARIFSGSYGALNYSIKMHGYGVRGCLALKFNT